jgi:hypothetical protein
LCSQAPAIYGLVPDSVPNGPQRIQDYLQRLAPISSKDPGDVFEEKRGGLLGRQNADDGVEENSFAVASTQPLLRTQRRKWLAREPASKKVMVWDIVRIYSGDVAMDARFRNRQRSTLHGSCGVGIGAGSVDDLRI